MNKQKSLSIEEKKINQCYKTCKNYMKDNDNLLLVKADEGNMSVFMKKQDYVDKAESMLSGVSSYTKIRNPTSSIQNKNNELVKRLHVNKIINYATKYRLSCNNAIPPRMYFLPKYHNENLLLRPFALDLNGPTNKMSKYLNEIFSSIVKSKYYLKNSFEFKDFICGQTWSESEVMCSFFTNTPIEKVIEIIEKKWNEISKYTSIPMEYFLKMVSLCTNNSYFLFNGNCYRQSYGTPMGSSISPILEEILMDEILDRAIIKVKNTIGIEIRLIKKYVDDIFIVLPHEAINDVLEIFNSIEQRIQFTHENEAKQTLPFLDMIVIRDTNEHKLV